MNLFIQQSGSCIFTKKNVVYIIKKLLKKGHRLRLCPSKNFLRKFLLQERSAFLSHHTASSFL